LHLRRSIGWAQACWKEGPEWPPPPPPTLFLFCYEPPNELVRCNGEKKLNVKFGHAIFPPNRLVIITLHLNCCFPLSPPT
jgi:hypothetical protein